jgi:antirestriction protein
MLSWSPDCDIQPCEEYAIHDYEGFGDIRLNEYEDIKYVSKLGQILDNADDVDALCAWLGCASYPVSISELEKLAEDFSSYYCGHWQTETDFVLKSDEIEAIYNWSEFEKQFKFWSQHIDWDSVARELFMEGYDSVKASPSGIYVFREYHD